MSEIGTVLGLVEKVLEKKKSDQAKRQKWRVLTAVYVLGNSGRDSVKTEAIKDYFKEQIPKSEILEILYDGEIEGLVTRLAYLGSSPIEWQLEQKACEYIEALIEEGKV